MELRINKLAKITGNGPQRLSETTWSLPIRMLKIGKAFFFFSFSFLESKKKSNAGLLKQMRQCPRNICILFFSLINLCLTPLNIYNGPYDFIVCSSMENPIRNNKKIKMLMYPHILVSFL